MKRIKLNNSLTMTFMILLIALATTISPAWAKVRVVTTTTDIADIAGHVGGDKATVTSIARGNQDPHHVEPKPSFMLLLRRADLYLVAGMDLEIGWSPALERGARNPNVMRGSRGYIDCSVGIPRVNVPPGGADRAMGDVHPHGNPHYLLDPQNSIIVAGTIADALIRKDPANRDNYEKNRDSFISRVRKSQIEWLRKMQPYKGLKVVAYHDNWGHFSRRFGLDVVEFVEPKPGISPSPAHVARVIQTMKSQNVKIIIMAPYFSRNIPELIAKNTGAVIITLPHTVGAVDGADDYFQWFDMIINRLVQAARQTR